MCKYLKKLLGLFIRSSSLKHFHILLKLALLLLGYGRLKSALMSSLKITDSSTAAKVREQHSPKLSRQEIVEDQRDDISIASDMSDWQQMGNFLRIELPGHGSTVVSMKEDMTFYDVVRAVTNKRQLNPEMYFIMFGVEKQSQIGNFNSIFLYVDILSFSM